MGEYFLGINPDRNERVTASELGGGAKRAEILHSGASVLDAIAILIADPGAARRRPADLGARGMMGRWAAERCILVGDGGGDGSGSWPWEVGEDEMYAHALTNGMTVGPRVSAHVARAHGMVMAVRMIRMGYLDGTKETVRSAVMVPVRNDDGVVAMCEPDSEGYAQEYADAARRSAGMPIGRFVMDARDGPRRLVANLDRREYLDPRHLAEHPTLVGMLRGHSKWWDPEDAEVRPHPPSTLMLLGEMILPRRGGPGDFGARWRGDRLVITAERSNMHPTTRSIENDAGWTDITPILLSMLPAVDWSHYQRRMHRQIYGDIGP